MAFSLLFVLLPFLSTGESADIIPAGFRKDFFYPYDRYREVGLPDPIHGGRFQLVGVSQATGRASVYLLDGKQVRWADDDWTVDWMHVYPPILIKGEPMWVSFHSRYSESVSLLLYARHFSRPEELLQCISYHIISYNYLSAPCATATIYIRTHMVEVARLCMNVH